MLVPHASWVVIVDGEKALFLVNHGGAQLLDLRVFNHFSHDNPPNREQASDKPGRLYDTAVGMRSAVETTDFHRAEKRKFANEIHDFLLKHARQKDFEKLILVAPPQMLGDFRAILAHEVKERLYREVEKDLTQFNVKEIEAHLQKL